MNATDIWQRIQDGLKKLRMPGLGRELEGLFREARERQWGLEELMLEMVNSELRSREESVSRLRLKQAKFPEIKTLDGFDYKISQGIDVQSIIRLVCCEWVANRQSLIFAGPIGTGKTHLAIALGVEACKRKYRVRFFRAADLVRDLTEARDDRQLGKMHRHLLSQDVLILDELGFVPFDRVGGELLFNILADRYERRSTLITTNLTFSEWPRVFGNDEKLTGALLDRLVHHCEIITTQGASYRLRHSKNKHSKIEGASS